MTRIVEILLRRPVGVTAFYVVLGALAVVAWVRMPVALLPSLAYPALVVWTAWPEVQPDRVERSVTIPVEQTMGGVPGITQVTSRSQLGGSLVRLDFGWNTDLDLAALEVRQKLDRVAGLPARAERPLVLRVDPSERPIAVLALGLLHAAPPTPAELLDLKQVGEDVVARRLEQLAGVARVRVTGGYEREVRVDVAPERMAAYGIDLRQIERALQEANVELVGGTVEKGPFRYSVEVSGELRDSAEVAAVVVSATGGPPVRLSDVAEVGDAVARRRGLVRLDGREVLLLMVERQPDANTIEAAAAVRRSLGELGRELPGVDLSIVIDESVFVEEAIAGVVQALFWGGLLAVVVLLVFLRRPRLLAAVAVAVPLSLAIALLLFDLLGVTLNLISLSGLALGVGLLVDNAIVVVENISRLREKGLPPLEAAAAGASEVAGPITASTLTTLAVFLPLTLVEGLAGRLFRDQSLAVACSVSSSLLVALTVVPLIASRERSDVVGVSPGPALAPALYEQLLGQCLARPARTIAGSIAFILLAAAVAFHLPRQVVPETDEGRVEVRLTLPADSGLPLVEARSRAVEAALARAPGVAKVLADLGERDDARLELEPRPPYAGDLTVVSKPGTPSRPLILRASDLAVPLDVELEARAIRTQLERLLVSEGSDLVIDLVADQRARAERLIPALLLALAARPELTNVARSDPESLPAYDLRFERDALVRFGAEVEVLDSYLEAAARGREATRLHQARDEVPIVLRTGISSVESLLAHRLPTAGGSLPISSFVRATPVSLPAMLLRHGQAPVVRLNADVAPGRGLEEALAAVDAALAAVVPGDVRARVGGANEGFRRSVRALTSSLLLSVALVYLILAAQFESLAQPLVVMSSVPLALGGVALVLAITGQSWNLMSLIGCVVLVGLAVNDAILKVEAFNRRRREGFCREAAVRQAGRDRLRPIVMTTLTTALGVLPMALGWGAGGSLQAPMAIAIGGGLVMATVLTLIVLPVLLHAMPGFRSAGVEGSSSRRTDKRNG